MPSPILCFTGKRAYLLGSLGSGRLLAVGEEGVASVLAGHGVHHQTQIPDLARRLEQGDQRVFEQVVRDVPDVDLQNFSFFSIFEGKLLSLKMVLIGTFFKTRS